MDWKEHANIFANGNFKARELQFEYTERIMGIDMLNNELILEGGMQAKIRHCTLIARPILDMTDEEVSWFWENDQNTYDVGDVEGIKGSIAGSFYKDYPFTYPVPEFLYLLSIGVYPFDQQAFETGTVIDSETT